MPATHKLLIILRSHERIRTQYFNGLSQPFPELSVNVVSRPADADPYLADADIIVTHGPHLEDKADHVFSHAKKLKWVQGIGTGVDGIADQAALPANVVVTNIHGVHGAPMSEAAMSLMLALNRKLQRSFDNQKARKWENWPSRLLYEKTVGILGMGSIAEAMGPRLKAFGMTVLGFTSGVRPVAGFDHVYEKSRLAEFLPQFDYFIVLTPYTPQTHHMIDATVMQAMRPDAYLINLARGGVVDEAALLHAVKSKQIAGAALDVFSQEPLKPESPLWDLDNVIITCHQAATHENSARNNLPTIQHNVRCFLAGDFAGMRNIIDRSAPFPAS